MALQSYPPPVIWLYGNRCIVVKGFAEIQYLPDGTRRVLNCSSDCIFTTDGYAEGQSNNPWHPYPGIPERMHPFPPVGEYT